MTQQNPFRPAQAKAAPRASGMTKKDGDMIARVMAKEVKAIMAPIEERLGQLEKALEYAQAEAERAVTEHLTGES